MEAKAPESSLLPSDPAERALCQQRLYFDAGTLYPRVRAIAVSVSTPLRLNVNDKLLLRVKIEKVVKNHKKEGSQTTVFHCMMQAMKLEKLLNGWENVYSIKIDFRSIKRNELVKRSRS